MALIKNTAILIISFISFVIIFWDGAILLNLGSNEFIGLLYPLADVFAGWLSGFIAIELSHQPRKVLVYLPIV